MRNRVAVQVLILSCLFSNALCAQVSLKFIASKLTSHNFQSPLFATAPAGDTERLFVVERGSGDPASANIRVLELQTEQASQTPFLTIDNVVTRGEAGLLGMAFHPNYFDNGFFYVYVAVPGGTENHLTQVRRYQVQGDPRTSNVADPSSMQTVLSFSQPASNHDGGWIGFNPRFQAEDPQYLYVAIGDGGGSGDAQNNAQDTTNNWLGKMLRIDVNGDDFPNDPLRNYAIPPTNPFVGGAADDEIWAYGLRNPWRASFNRDNGDLWIGDVGQDLFEEVNFQSATSLGGENYGWRVMEGNSCFDNAQVDGNAPCFASVLTAPIYDYSHTQGPLGGRSVTGGYIYHGSVAAFDGLYIFADFFGNVWTLDPYAVSINESVIRRNEDFNDQGFIGGLVSFAEDDRGELYLLQLGGDLMRIETTSQQLTWNGDQTVGQPGDGVSWSDVNNWTRGGNVDEGFVAADEVIFGGGSSSLEIDLQGDRTVSGAVFEADYTLRNGQLRVLSGNVRVAQGVSATLDADAAAETAGTSIRKLGDGMLTVNGNVGQTVVLEGSLGGTGSFDFLTVYPDAVVAVGEVGNFGSLTTGEYRQLGGAKLRLEIGETQGVADSDRLVGTTNAELSGVLEIQPIDAYSDPDNRGQVDEFILLQAGGAIRGMFEAVSYAGEFITPGHQSAGLFRLLEQDGSEIIYSNYLALTGDADGNRVVDFTDFLILTGNFGQAGGWTDADFDFTGVVDFSDFLLLAGGFGTSAGAAEMASTSAVPEPTGQLLASLFFILFVGRRWCPRTGHVSPTLAS